MLGGALSTMPRITAVSQPDRSATPTPSNATSTVPSGANSTKLRTRLRIAQWAINIVDFRDTDAAMTIQVHDELIVEAPESDCESA